MATVIADCCLRDEGHGWQEVEWVLEEEGEEHKWMGWQRFAMCVCSRFRSLDFSRFCLSQMMRRSLDFNGFQILFF